MANIEINTPRPGGSSEILENSETLPLTSNETLFSAPFGGNTRRKLPVLPFSLAFLVTFLLGIILGAIVASAASQKSKDQGSKEKPTQNDNSTINTDFPLNFLVVGDWGRDGDFNQSTVAQAMGSVGDALNVNFVVSTGDNFYESGLSSTIDSKFETSFSQIYTHRSLQTLWYAVLGNHDYVTNPLAELDPQLKMRDPRWHCQRNFTISRSVCSHGEENCSSEVELIFLDTSPLVEAYWDFLNFSSLTSREEETQNIVQALENSLKASTARWKLVIGHHPIRSTGVHGDTPELIKYILPVLEENKVDLYINGHDHALEFIQRDDSSIPLVTSGAGSKCYRPQNNSTDENGLKFGHNGQGFVSVGISSNSLVVVFYDLFEKELYRFNLEK